MFRKKTRTPGWRAVVIRALIVSMVLLVAGTVPLFGLAFGPQNAEATVLFNPVPNAVGNPEEFVNPHATALADVDGDGDLDIITGTGGYNATGRCEVIVWENDGTPFAGTWPQHVAGVLSDWVYSVDTADVDNDGQTDIVTGTGSAEDYEIVAWENDGTPFDGLWSQHDIGAVVPGTSGTGPASNIALADLDRDGWTDIVCVPNEYSGNPWQVTVWRNDQTPFDGLWTSLPIFTGYCFRAVETGDFDNDGWEDVAFNYNEYYIMIARNDHTPFDGGWAFTGLGFNGMGGTAQIKAADFDNDGWLDLATALAYQPSWEQVVWRNDGTPFDGGWSRTQYAPSTWFIDNLAVADFDLDGRTDIAVPASLHYANHTPLVFTNDGTPFDGAWPWSQIGTPAYRMGGFVAGDLDGDGDPDLVTVSSSEALSPSIDAWQNLAITNTPPDVSLGEDVTLDEGALLSPAGSFSDPGSNFWTATVDYGDGSGVRALELSGQTFNLNHVYADNGAYSVTVTVTDDEGGVGSDISTVTVLNVAPGMDWIHAPAAPVIMGTPVTVEASFYDAGWLDTHTAAWDWGDGTTSPGTVTESGGCGTVTDDHTYASPGEKTITITVMDDDGGFCTATATVVIVLPATVDFDPNTINLKSKGNYVTVYIELPVGYDVGQIDVSSIRLNDTVPALAKPTAIGDYDKDGIPDLMVKFDRAAVQAKLAAGDQVEITISGKVAGIDFRGTDTIKVLG